MRDPELFLILSGNRCGSTWLSFMLNALPDVRTEFEHQWAETVPSDLHVAMNVAGFDLASTLTAISADAPIRGSKMVAPGGVKFSEADYASIWRSIPADVKVIHLTRRYIDSFLSKLRDQGQLRNHDGVAPPPLSSRWLQSELRPKPMQKAVINVDDLAANLSTRLANDGFFRSFRQRVGQYLMVDYTGISSSFANVAHHVGSHGAQAEIDIILARPPSAKLPKFDYAQLVENFDEVMLIGEDFERRRLALLTEISEPEVRSPTLVAANREGFGSSVMP